MKRIVAIFSLTLFVGCVRMPPQATAPTSCAPACPWPTKAWLTVEEHKKIVRWVETKTFPDNTFDVKLSKDGVVKIAGIRDEYLVPIYEGFRGLLAEEGEKFSKRAFKKALRRGQITCHLAAATWPEEYYRGVSGTECVNDLLLSLPVPRNAEYLLPQIGIISIPPDDGMADGSPEHLSPPEGLIPVVAMERERSPRTVTWDDILPILRASTVFKNGSTAPGTQNYSSRTCSENIPIELVKHDPPLTGAVVAAVDLFSQSEKVGFPIFEHYRKSENPEAIWEDPCLPGELESFLKDQQVHLLLTPEMAAAETACQLQAGQGE